MQTNVGRVGSPDTHAAGFHSPSPCMNVGKQSGLDRTFVCDSRLLDQVFVGPGDQTGRPYILVYWTELGIRVTPDIFDAILG